MNISKKLFFLVTTGFIIFTGFSTNIFAGAGLPNGTYESDYERVHFVCPTRQNCNATYDYYRKSTNPFTSYLYGWFTANNEYEGYWVQKRSGVNCSKPYKGSYNWGTVRFKFNSTMSAWRGTWGYCNRDHAGVWNSR